MARRRGRRRRKSNVALQFNDYSIQRTVQEFENYQGYKKKQKEFLEKVAESEEEILTRTIFVSQVKDLKQPRNLQLLKAFFEITYGPVEECVATTFSSKKRKGRFPQARVFPPARVRFSRKPDAEKIFGVDLYNAARGKSIEIRPGGRFDHVAHGGLLRIRPSEKYPNMVDHLLDNTKIEFPTSNLALGHWCPDDEHLFGDFETKEETIGSEWLEEENTQLACSVAIDLTARVVEIQMINSNSSPNIFDMLFGVQVDLDAILPKTYSISFRFKDLVQSMELCREPNGSEEYSFVFNLKYPPKLFRSTTLLLVTSRERSTSIPGISNACFGRCLGFKLSLSSSIVDRLLLNEGALRKLQNFGVMKDGVHAKELAKNISVVDVGGLRIESTGDDKTNLLLRSLFDKGKCTLYHTFQDRVSIDGQRVNLFDLCRSAPPSTTHKVLEKMCEMVDRTRLPARLFLELQNAEELTEETADGTFVPSYCVQIPRLLLTPTRVSVIGFEVEMSNRVVRKFVEDAGFCPESFCRVSIGDENGDKLFSSELSDDVSNRIEKTLLEGIEANGLRYQFLAYSSSQLKESSVWMVRVENRWTIPKMRAWMGDFSCCKTPSKYAARMGLCFSTTFQAQAASVKKGGVFDRKVLLRVSDTQPDVVIWNQGELCHSDGTGLINTDKLRMVVEGLPFAPKDPSEVSIIQVRIGGAKGTLTGWNMDDLKKNRTATHPVGKFDVYLRPSMVKFTAPYRHLEVIKIGSRTPYYLNRHVILLLNASGVSIDTFCEMQRTMLDDLNRLLTDRDRAMNLLPSLGGADSTLTSTLMHMLNSGLSPSGEPFLYSCLHAIRAYHLTNLRKKARIFVEKGVVLMAGLDETGLLPEGCVFLQLRRSRGSPETDPNVSSKYPILGPVMVTKHPALHPGDVRMLLAVDIPELRDHKNVLLFSQRGSDRPEADKMSGSDLDGDEFAITWDTRLFLSEWNRCIFRQSDSWVSTNGDTVSSTLDMARSAAILQASNQRPGSYEAAVPIENPPDDVFSNQQLVKYMVYFAKNDNIGRIANLWLDHAAKDGARSDSCIRLAHWCSIAVDFPKSGIPAVVPKDLYIQDARAHWRELKGVRSYHDEGVIGRLYDAVDVNPTEDHEGLAGRSRDRYGQILCFVKESQDELRAELYLHELPARLGFRSSGNEDEDTSMLRFARAQRREYNDDLFTLMNKYKLHSEGELLTGLMRKYHRLNKRRRHAVSEELRRSCREMRHNYREAFFLQVWSFVRGHAGHSDQEATPSRSGGQDSDDEDSLSDEERNELVKYITKVTTEKIGYLDAREARETMDITIIQDYALRLAAAYYMVTYGRREQTQALFSFPWLVADVIASGLNSFE